MSWPIAEYMGERAKRDLGLPFDACKMKPETWIPVSENPSKLTLHIFHNGEWFRTSFVRFVSWPEAFPPQIEKVS